MKLEGKVALITGGAGGIGSAVALKFASEGADLVLVDINEEALKYVKMKIGAKFPDTRVLTVKADITCEEEVIAYVRQTVDTFGSIDILFNNAGVLGNFAATIDYQFNDFKKVMQIDLFSAFLNFKYILPVMVEHGGGTIISTSSFAGTRSSATAIAYGAAKSALVNMTKSVAIEYAKVGVRANAISPGTVRTRIAAKIMGDALDDYLESAGNNIPIGRICEPEEIANLVCFLASSDSSYITGQVIAIDGGASVLAPL